MQTFRATDEALVASKSNHKSYIENEIKGQEPTAEHRTAKGSGEAESPYERPQVGGSHAIRPEVDSEQAENCGNSGSSSNYSWDDLATSASSSSKD